MIQPIILAAGKGTRMNSDTPKALFRFMDKPLIQWVIDAIERARVTKPPMIVVGHKSEYVKKELGPDFTYIEQSDISGTASAVKSCLPYLDQKDNILILYSDQPLVRSESIEKIERSFELHPDALVMGVVHVENYDEWREPLSKYGRIIRNAKGDLQKIVEYKDASEEERKILEVNPSVFCVNEKWLASAIERITPSPVSGEYYLTDIVMLAAADKKTIVTIDLTPEETIGINSVEDAQKAVQVYQRIQAR